MFYDLNLLRRQNEGRFAMAWAAATRGIVTVTREYGSKKVNDLDIILLSKEIMEYLQSRSNDPEKRLSLRMTIFLIRGTILLFQKQVSLFQGEVLFFFNKVNVPYRISSPTRDVVPTQRDFITPPTPVIKKKRKSKKPVRAADENLILEEILRLEEPEEESTALERPIDADQRRRNLEMVEVQPLLNVGISDDLFGDFGMVPMVTAPVQVPRLGEKAPSEAESQKSVLQKIEELLATEEKQQNVAEEEPTKLKRKKRSSSIEGSPKIFQVEVMVHQPLGEEEKVAATVTEEAPTKLPEIMMEKSIAPEVRRIDVTEVQKIMEEIQEAAEKDLEKEAIPVGEKTVPLRKDVLRQVQEDEIPIEESEVLRKKKAVQIDENLLKKFKKPKKFLHLDDYDKMYELKDDFPIDIYNDRMLDVDLTNAVMREFSNINIIEPPEMVRVEGISIGRSSDAHGPIPKLSQLTTPIDSNVGSTPQYLTRSTHKHSTIGSTVNIIEPPEMVRVEGISIGQSSDAHGPIPKLPQLPTPLDSNVGSTLQDLTLSTHIGSTVPQSTPFRVNVTMPSKKLYDETRIEIVGRGHHQRRNEKFAAEFSVDQIVSTDLEGRPSESHQEDIEGKRREVEGYSITEPFVQKLKLSEEQSARRKIIIQTVKQWNEAQGDLTFDDLIPTPKNKLNAAVTFGDLLALSKDGYVTLFAEENSILLKHVKKGRLLQ